MTLPALNLLKSMIAANREGEGAVNALIYDAMTKAGCRVDYFDYVPANVPLVDEFALGDFAPADVSRCVIGRLEGDEAAPSLLLFAHPDVEALPADHGWSSEPYRAVERAGRLHGLGVADDLAGVAMLTGALDCLRARGQQPVGDVILVSAPSKSHRRGIAAALHAGLHADAAIYLHPAESSRGLDDIKAFAPGQLSFRIELAGRPPETAEPSHAAFAHKAVNPFSKAIQLAATLQAYDANRAQAIHHPSLQKAIGRSTNLMLTSCSFGDPDYPNQIASMCTLGGSMTLIPGEKLANLQEEIQHTIQLGCRNDPWLKAHPPEITWLSGITAAETPVNGPLYQLTEQALQKAGASPSLNPLHTSSDIRNPIIQKSIPTVGYGPLCGNLTQAGHTDEWIDIADFHRSIEATADIIHAWCGRQSS